MPLLNKLLKLAQAHEADLNSVVQGFEIGTMRFDGNVSPSVMGVVNLSPDSWYRESVCLSAEAAIRRGRVLVGLGAHIIDVGAESTLSHAALLDHSAQSSLLLPVVKELSQEGILVSVETYLPQVARTVLAAGARILNLTGTQHSEELFRSVADHGAGVILCYVQGPNVRTVTDFNFNRDPVATMYEHFARQIEAATSAGVTRLWIDPGLGFYYRNLQDSAARIRHQSEVFLNSFRLRKLGWPVCHALPHAFEIFGEEVRCAEAFFAVLASLGRTDLYRTHEVPKVRAILETLALIE